MESKHTPGTWINAERSAGAHIHADQGEIAWIRSNMGISNEQIEANAHLISAAPDMLDALKEAADFIQPFNRAEELLDRIEAVIAKAEGRS